MAHKLTDTVSWYMPIYALYEQRLRSKSDISDHMPRLKAFVELLKPRRIIELGVSTGNSTLSFLTGFGAEDYRCKLYSVDMSPIHGELASWQDKIPEWKFILSKDLPMPPELPSQARIIFIDTEHNYPQCIAEIREYAPHLQQNGVMLFHDTDDGMNFGVKKAMLEFAAKFEYFCHFWTGNYGLGVLYRRSEAARIDRVIAHINTLVQK